jgi:chromosome segregation ATPase
MIIFALLSVCFCCVFHDSFCPSIFHVNHCSELKKRIKALKAENTSCMEKLSAGGGTIREGSSEKDGQSLLNELEGKRSELADARSEISKLREALHSIDTTGNNNAVLHVERELREQAESRAEKERSERLSAEAMWNSLSEQVEYELDTGRRQLEVMAQEKIELEKEVRACPITPYIILYCAL